LALNSSLTFSMSTLRMTGLKFWFLRVIFRTFDFDLSFLLFRFNRVTAMTCVVKRNAKVSPFAEFAKRTAGKIALFTVPKVDFMRHKARGFLSGGINLAANYGKTRTSQRNPRFRTPGHVPAPIHHERHPGRVPALWLRPPGDPCDGKFVRPDGEIRGDRKSVV